MSRTRKIIKTSTGSKSEVTSDLPSETRLRLPGKPKKRLLQSSHSSLRCSYCHDSLGANIAHCQYCGTFIHNECWKEHGSCICGEGFVAIEEPMVEMSWPSPFRVEPKPSSLKAILRTIGYWSLSIVIAILVAAANYYIR